MIRRPYDVTVMVPAIPAFQYTLHMCFRLVIEAYQVDQLLKYREFVKEPVKRMSLDSHCKQNEYTLKHTSVVRYGIIFFIKQQESWFLHVYRL